MNLQHWINQHPAAFAAIFPIYFLCLWLLVGAIISIIGGWFSLAKVYRTRVPFNGTKWTMQSGQMRWRVNYNNVLTIGASPEGLYLASMFLFRFMHPPLLLPWSEIKVRRKKGWVFEYLTFTMGHEFGNPFADSGEAGNKAARIGWKLLASRGDPRRVAYYVRLCEDQFPPLEVAGARFEAIDLNPARWAVNQPRWKCYLLSLLRIHHSDCELCNAREKYGEEMRKRLDELNWRTQPHSPSNGVLDSKPAEVVASPPISLAQQQKKIA